MGNPAELTRRELIARAGIFSAGMALAWPRPARAADDKDEKEEAGEEISPAEDLMREHGALERMLLIFEQQQKLLEGAGDFNKWAIGQTAGLIRQFIAEYHERLEENDIFPLFKQGPLADPGRPIRPQPVHAHRLSDDAPRRCKFLCAGSPAMGYSSAWRAIHNKRGSRSRSSRLFTSSR